jgi:gluconate kinase
MFPKSEGKNVIGPDLAEEDHRVASGDSSHPSENSLGFTSIGPFQDNDDRDSDINHDKYRELRQYISPFADYVLYFCASLHIPTRPCSLLSARR